MNDTYDAQIAAADATIRRLKAALPYSDVEEVARFQREAREIKALVERAERQAQKKNKGAR